MFNFSFICTVLLPWQHNNNFLLMPVFYHTKRVSLPLLFWPQSIWFWVFCGVWLWLTYISIYFLESVFIWLCLTDRLWEILLWRKSQRDSRRAGVGSRISFLRNWIPYQWTSIWMYNIKPKSSLQSKQRGECLFNFVDIPP